MMLCIIEKHCSYLGIVLCNVAEHISDFRMMLRIVTEHCSYFGIMLRTVVKHRSDFGMVLRIVAEHISEQTCKPFLQKWQQCCAMLLLFVCVLRYFC